MRSYIITMFLTVGITHIVWSQAPDREPFGIEYTMVPDIGDVSMQQYNAQAAIGKRLGKGMIGFGVNYTHSNFTFNNATTNFDTSSYETFHTIRGNLFYRRALGNSWSGNLVVSPVLSSNFESGISSEDFFINAIASVSKRWRKDESLATLTMGLGYGTMLGKPRFIPVISYRKKINDQWSYGLGAPKTNVQYQLNPKNEFVAFAGFNGLFANNSSSVTFSNTESLTDTKIQYNSLNLGLEHHFKIQPNWTTLIRLGYSPWNQLRILDNDFNEVYEFETNGSLFISMGLRFNLKTKSNENKK
ncbi:DUF6268 family outer membrane beta-barrel protein [Aquimarina sp. 2201CG5-10]|uniref:DUF6268 family outer membrane beta-barrel protein n=1 Tax=Aquimarina callyspongiae TaxID=3098150 RepID=UPI002AB575FC|nr:DUF6268 family outer membrane beta-barrel protein [Aquimarina sp. 2201CG5-10]MDY8136140.1 DUF6268 family outer membrane beta-barrel protein [Aquimarina sp. 2201CG5-10]